MVFYYTIGGHDFFENHAVGNRVDCIRINLCNLVIYFVKFYLRRE